jgi:hypothetical protein
MTPKEKAESLVALMYDVDFWDDEDQHTMQHHHAKKCALIAVDEIISLVGRYTNNYWEEVKREIDKL